jgi:hypothetical protein
MYLASNVALMEIKIHNSYFGKPEGKRAHTHHLGIGGRLMLKWVMGNKMEVCVMDSCDSG